MGKIKVFMCVPNVDTSHLSGTVNVPDAASGTQ